MFSHTRAAALLALSPCLAWAGAWAAEPVPLPLPLAEAQRLALAAQPALAALEHEGSAYREQAVAARQLPDPQLQFGVGNLPVNTRDAWRFERDSQTASMVGLSQEIPSAAKRSARAQTEFERAASAEADGAAMARRIGLDAGLAWVDVYVAERGLSWVEALQREAQRKEDAAGLAYRAAQIPQSELLASRVATGLLQDRHYELEQRAAKARAGLARWIGDEAAQRPLPIGLPSLPDPPPPAQLLAALARHPQQRAAAANARVAETDLQAAQAGYHPDWRVGAQYGERFGYSEMLSLTVGVDLPLFTAQRQDRSAAAARAALEAAHEREEDTRRELAAQAQAAYAEWDRLRQRRDYHEQTLAPAAEARSAAALTAYRAGRGRYQDVLDARKDALDVHLMGLDIDTELLRRQLELLALAPEHAAEISP